MHWCTVVERVPHAQLENSVHEEIGLVPQLLISSNKPQHFSLESQFFIAPFVLLDSNSRTILPVRNLETLSLIQNQIVPHFDRCFAFYRGDEPVAVNISKLKASTKKQFEQLLHHNQLHQFVTDLYQGTVILSNQSAFNHPTTIYQIHTEKLNACETNGVETLTRLIRETILSAEGHFTVVPTGWSFGEHVLQSPYLSFLATICKDIYLHVSQNDQSVVGISGYERR